MKTAIAVALLSLSLFAGPALAQSAPSSTQTATADNAVMLTVFLRHDQSKPLAEINA